MEFSVAKDILIKGLGRTQSVIEKKAALPILSNVLIEAKGDTIELIATDLEVGIKGKYDASLITEGSLTIGAKKLFEIVRELPEQEVRFKKLENNWVELICGKAQFNIVGLSSDDFPVLPSFEEEDFHTLPASMIAEMIEKVQHAISFDETRYYLNGVYFCTVEKEGKRFVRMVSTDGHRLALIDRELPEGNTFENEEGCIIPRKGITELRKALNEVEEDAQFCFKDRNLIVRCDSLLFIIRLIDGEFPDYSQVIPTNNDRSMTCSRDQLVGSLRRVSLLSAELNKGVQVALKKKILEISSSNPELGDAKEEIIVTYDNEEMSIGFNARYMLEVLSVINDEDVVVELADNLKPGLIRSPSDPNFVAVLMPMRI